MSALMRLVRKRGAPTSLTDSATSRGNGEKLLQIVDSPFLPAPLHREYSLGRIADVTISAVRRFETLRFSARRQSGVRPFVTTWQKISRRRCPLTNYLFDQQ